MIPLSGVAPDAFHQQVDLGGDLLGRRAAQLALDGVIQTIDLQLRLPAFVGGLAGRSHIGDAVGLTTLDES